MIQKRTIFIAGIIQGSCLGKDICQQEYRSELTTLLRDNFPDWNVFCPVENYPNSVNFPDEKASDAFFDLMGKAGKADVVIAYLPQASLGTAIELWQAHQAKKTIFTISPMSENWVIKFLPNKNFESLETFKAFVQNGDFKNIIEKI
jgi:hypothetical protein